MNAKLSPHASGLLNDIIDTIADELSLADVRRAQESLMREVQLIMDEK